MKTVRECVHNLISMKNMMLYKDWEQQIASTLHRELPDYSWVGFYRLEGDELVLGVWDGEEATEHVRIPAGEGVCGSAAAKKQTIIVDDVNEESNYLACFPETKSEIVIPIFLPDGDLVGELDVDGGRVGAFSEDDRLALEQLGAEIATHPGFKRE